MKTLPGIFLTVLAICSACFGFAQQPEWLNPKPFGYKVNDIGFFNANKGMMVGTMGAVALTSDGGQSWITVTSGTNNTFLKAAITSTSSAIIMSDDKLLKTDNYGTTWQPLHQLQNRKYISIDMVNASNGFSLVKKNSGNYTFEVGRTTDGGITWAYTILDSLPDLDYYSDIAFENENEGILIRRNSEDASIYKTSNGGVTFSLVFNQNGSIRFLSAEYAGGGYYYTSGFLITDNDINSISRALVYKSTDHGNNWLSTFPINDLGIGNTLKGIKAYDQQTIYTYGIVAGEESHHIPPIFVSFNGGQSWEKANIPNVYEWIYNPAITALGISNQLRVVAYTTGVELPIKTENALNFNFFDGAFGGHLTDGSFTGNTVNFCTELFVLHSTNGGNSFDTVNIEPNTSNVELNLNKIAFASGTEGLATGISYSNAGTADIFRTQNGGVSWERIVHNSLAKPIDLNFMAWNSAYLFGENYTFQPYQVHKKLFVSENMGNSWSELNLPDDSLNNMQFINPQTGFLFGGSTTSGGYYKTIDGGNTWNFNDLGLQKIKKGRMLNDSLGFVLEESTHTIYALQMVNGQNIVSPVFSGVGTSVADFGFTSYETGYVLVNDAANNDTSWIFQTNNAGTDWVQYGPYPAFNGLKIFYDQNGFAYGDYGRLLKLGNGYPIGLPVLNADMARLEVSPNPASDNINIEWQLPEGCQVGQLKIFNIAGQEKYQLSLTGKTGNKSIDLQKFAPGVYLLTLSTTNQTLVSKKLSVCK
ncbi:MAG: T9SS type A sorting domain-containing protein [Bacteroidales bacterium]|nr:T9SS type A sorting domain-containing protein [Bacteroidales bacterium]